MFVGYFLIGWKKFWDVSANLVSFITVIICFSKYSPRGISALSSTHSHSNINRLEKTWTLQFIELQFQERLEYWTLLLTDVLPSYECCNFEIPRGYVLSRPVDRQWENWNWKWLESQWCDKDEDNNKSDTLTSRVRGIPIMKWKHSGKTGSFPVNQNFLILPCRLLWQKNKKLSSKVDIVRTITWTRCVFPWNEAISIQSWRF